ncbi:MAG: hypothetical protein EHM45_17245 [Desulfobacteraceae bacterium]|nr:MAG: hypothetical protein EHM45_17245 [Desulfobacteraceae bacterium]
MLKNMIKNYRKPLCIACWGCLWTGVFGAPESRAYVLPPEQLVEFMAVNFNSFDNLMINQITKQEAAAGDEIGEDRVFREKVSMQASGNYHLEILEQTAEKLEGADRLFRQFLLNIPKEKQLALLLKLGIDLQQVEHTRLDGVVAYRIGRADGNSPQLVIEKKRFLPLYLVYRQTGDPQARLARVRFRDYRSVKDKWYPYDITYTLEDRLTERYMIQGLENNVPLDAGLFKTPKPVTPLQTAAPIKKLSPEEKEKLKKIIEAFEKKYE